MASKDDKKRKSPARKLSESERKTRSALTSIRKKLRHEQRLAKKARHMSSRATRLGPKAALGTLARKHLQRGVRKDILPFILSCIIPGLLSPGALAG